MRDSMGTTTRDRILATTRGLFAERGFHGVSLAEIAAALTLTKQAVLHYFPTKEKLYAAVLVGVAGELEAILTRATASESTPAGQLQQVFEALQSHDESSRLRARLLVRALMDIEQRSDDPRAWPLRRFLDELVAMGRQLDAWQQKSDAAVFAALYQLIGAVSYFAISEATLTGMYGERKCHAIRSAFAGEVTQLLATRTGAAAE